MFKSIFAAIFFLFFCVTATQAQARCQCSASDWEGDCRASIKLKKKNFIITSNTDQCSRIDWYIDGNPNVTIVTDGVEVEEWLGQSSSPNLAIQSCKICKDMDNLFLSDSKDSSFSDRSTKPDLQETVNGCWEAPFPNNQWGARGYFKFCASGKSADSYSYMENNAISSPPTSCRSYGSLHVSTHSGNNVDFKFRGGPCENGRVNESSSFHCSVSNDQKTMSCSSSMTWEEGMYKFKKLH
jgi:hypothetical protein